MNDFYEEQGKISDFLQVMLINNRLKIFDTEKIINVQFNFRGFLLVYHLLWIYGRRLTS